MAKVVVAGVEGGITGNELQRTNLFGVQEVSILASADTSWKLPVRLSSVINVALPATPPLVDGVAPVDGDRILLLGQTAGAENGPYVTQGGVLARAPDFDAGADFIEAGVKMVVQEGTVRTGKTYRLATTGAITLGVTSLSFVEDTPAPTAAGADFLTQHNAGQWNPDVVGISIGSFGILAAPNTVAAPTSAVGFTVDGAFKDFITAAVGSSFAGIRNTSGILGMQPGFTFGCKCELRDLAPSDDRMFVGVCNLIGGFLTGDDPVEAHLGFQFSTSRPDVNWQLTRKPTDGGVQTLVDTGVPEGGTGVKFFEIAVARGGQSAVCRILSPTGAVLFDSGVINTNLPGAGLLTQPQVQLELTGASGPKTLRFFDAGYIVLGQLP